MAKQIEWIGLKELRAAVNRNPQKILDEARMFLTRGLAVYKSGIIRDPWRVGGSGGGSPVANDPRYRRRNQLLRSGNLRDTHMTRINGLEGSIGPNLALASYAGYVHEGTRRMKARPWLDYVKRTKEGEIQTLYQALLKNIVSDLAN